MNELSQIPDTYQQDIRRAIEILKDAGCTDIYLFGSLASSKIRSVSDIDLAIRGCAKQKYFQLLGKLIFELDKPVDLVDLDRQDSFSRYLLEEGELLRIG